MQLSVPFETFYRGDLLSRGSTNLSDTGFGRLPVEQDRTGPTLSFAATVLCAGQVKLVAQYAKQVDIGIDVDCCLLPIDVKCSYFGHNGLPNSCRCVAEIDYNSAVANWISRLLFGVS